MENPTKRTMDDLAEAAEQVRLAKLRERDLLLDALGLDYFGKVQVESALAAYAIADSEAVSERNRTNAKSLHRPDVTPEKVAEHKTIWLADNPGLEIGWEAAACKHFKVTPKTLKTRLPRE